MFDSGSEILGKKRLTGNYPIMARDIDIYFFVFYLQMLSIFDSPQPDFSIRKQLLLFTFIFVWLPVDHRSRCHYPVISFS